MSRNEIQSESGPEREFEPTPIYVTSPSLPDLNDFIPLLEDIWNNRHLTNFGFYHKKFEQALGDFFETPYVSLVSNATLGLLIALRALDLNGKVITTPFSFVATAHAIKWNGLEPIFCDIDEKSMNIDPNEVEAKITEDVCAIMPVHVFGNPCDLDTFQALSDKYHLPLIYDAAHAFGVKINDKSLCVAGDYSVVSFHATKAFNTIEGGVVISRTAELKKKVDLLRNFGFVDEVSVEDVGINAKMNELQAAYGLLMLDRWEEILKSRRDVFGWYEARLERMSAVFLVSSQLATSNYSYLPIILDENLRDLVYEGLKRIGCYSRRYFYPLITEFKAYREMNQVSISPVATQVSRRILCLPISEIMVKDEVDLICDELQALISGVT